MSRAYPTAKDGEWIQPIRRGYRMACCDCGLVHEMDFRVVNGRVQFRPSRNNRATAMIRRHRCISVKKTHARAH